MTAIAPFTFDKALVEGLDERAVRLFKRIEDRWKTIPLGETMLLYQNGAAGDGLRDDTSAINALVAAHPTGTKFCGGGRTYKISTLEWPANANETELCHANFVSSNDAPMLRGQAGSDAAYDVLFRRLRFTAGGQSTTGQPIIDLTNFGLPTFEHVRTFGVDNVSDHWYGTGNSAGEAPYYVLLNQCYGGVGRYWFHAADNGSPSTGMNNVVVLGGRTNIGANRTAVRVDRYSQAIAFFGLTIETCGVGYSFDGIGCSVHGGRIEVGTTGVYFDTHAFGNMVDLPYASSLTTPVDGVTDWDLTNEFRGFTNSTGALTNFGRRSLRMASAKGAYMVQRVAEEEITLNTGGLTTDSSANLLPANSVIDSVTARITTTIGAATSWAVGDAGMPARFSAANTTLTAGTTSTGLDHWTSSLQQQAAAAKVRITTVGIPNAGKIRITVFYRQFTAAAA